MKNVYIFYSNYYDFLNEYPFCGGTQTYITNIAELCKEMGLAINIVQMGTENRKAVFEGINIIQYKAKNQDEFEKRVKKQMVPYVDVVNDLFIYATPYLVFKRTYFKKAIAIQHGICWDVPSQGRKNTLLTICKNSLNAYSYIRKLKKVKILVCVDYNFVNWLRTQTEAPVCDLKVIPNFTEISDQNKKTNDSIKIIFARRFYRYRGTEIFVSAIKRVLDDGENVSVTIAGTGPEEQSMKKILNGYKNVEFITYKSQESLKIHEAMDVAVVPTLGSEGTSLSLLEAMSAQCAVICTNVGGMTNIIINEYNGLMISPDEHELYIALKRLIRDKELRISLSKKAYETVVEGFSLEKWKRAWKTVINGFQES